MRETTYILIIGVCCCCSILNTVSTINTRTRLSEITSKVQVFHERATKNKPDNVNSSSYNNYGNCKICGVKCSPNHHVYHTCGNDMGAIYSDSPNKCARCKYKYTWNHYTHQNIHHGE